MADQKGVGNNTSTMQMQMVRRKGRSCDQFPIPFRVSNIYASTIICDPILENHPYPYPYHINIYHDEATH